MRLRIVLAASAFGAFSFAGPDFAASFDCRKMSAPAESAICGDTRLSAADSEMAAVYAATLAQLSPEGQHFVTEAQREWVHLTRRGADITGDPDTEHRSRDQVRFLTERYRDRIAQLKQSALRFGPYVWSRVDSYRYGVGSDALPGASNSVPRLAWIYAAYPRIDHPESAAALALNAKLKATSIQSFQYGEDAFGCGLGENGSGGGETEHVGNLSFANSKLVSVVWSNACYCFGAAHGQGSTIITNFVFAPELRPMRPEDIFEPGNRWREVLEHNAAAAFLEFRARIEEKLQTDELKVLRDAVSRVNGWSLTPEGIRFDFDPYSFGGYPSGARFTVPWGKLRSVLRPDSGLGDAQK
jgi:uncharacterized protein YecT (DUF1311 family)